MTANTNPIQSPLFQGEAITKIFKTDGSLVQVESIADCSTGAFCNTYDLH